MKMGFLIILIFSRTGVANSDTHSGPREQRIQENQGRALSTVQWANLSEEYRNNVEKLRSWLQCYEMKEEERPWTCFLDQFNVNRLASTVFDSHEFKWQQTGVKGTAKHLLELCAEEKIDGCGFKSALSILNRLSQAAITPGMIKPLMKMLDHPQLPDSNKIKLLEAINPPEGPSARVRPYKIHIEPDASEAVIGPIRRTLTSKSLKGFGSCALVRLGLLKPDDISFVCD